MRGLAITQTIIEWMKVLEVLTPPALPKNQASGGGE
jgi:hypothetical protein